MELVTTHTITISTDPVDALYRSLAYAGIVQNGRLSASLRKYYQSTQTKAEGIDVTKDLLQYLSAQKSNFVNYPLVSEIIEERREHGIEEWGVPLHTENGRSQTKDVEEELADALIYLWAMHLKGEMITPRIRNMMRVLAGMHEAMELGKL